MGTVLLYAFEPVEELEGRAGVAVVEEVLAKRLIEEHRAERIEDHATCSMRYVRGSPEHLRAANELREARDTRGLVEVRGVTRRKAQRASLLES
jgi:hypothetical protein